MFAKISSELLNGSLLDHISGKKTNILDRWSSHQAWWDERLAAGLDPYSKFTRSSIAPECDAATRDGSTVSGVNFGSQEYLSLASHPEVHRAAKDAIDRYGVHSAGSAALMGNTCLSVELESRLAAFLGYSDCTVFPTGWGAGYGVVKALVRPADHVVIDRLAHACLHEGARSATENVHTFSHLSNEHAKAQLEKIRSENPTAGILLITETLFSMDSDVPDITALQAICREYDATLMVDAAHDMGAIAPKGRGYLEHQGAVGLPDILMGSFSKTFASNGGYVACNNPNLKLALRYGSGPLTFTNALSPVQCSVVLKCLDIIESDEGAELRSNLMDNILYMRERVQAAGFTIIGDPSAIIPVILGDNAISRLTTHYAFKAGGITNLVEYPAVRRNTSRWRLQVMAGHTRKQIDHFVVIASGAKAMAEAHLSSLREKADVAELV